MTLAVQEAASLMNSLNSRCVLRLEAQGYQRQSSMWVVWWASLVQEGPAYVVNPLLGLVATKQTLPDRDSGSARIREGD